MYIIPHSTHPKTPHFQLSCYDADKKNVKARFLTVAAYCAATKVIKNIFSRLDGKPKKFKKLHAEAKAS